MKGSSVLPWYGLLLIILFCAAIVMREGFTATPSNFNEQAANKKVFVLFHTTTCPHCTELKPTWDKAAAQVGDTMMDFVVNSKDPAVEAIMSKYKINSYPTMLVLDNGEKVDTYEGPREEKDLVAYAKLHLGK